MAEGITASNGLAFSPDGRTLLWADTKAHAVSAFDVDGHDGSLSNRRVWRQFALRDTARPITEYGGRPDGAAMDSAGGYWLALFEGQRLLRLDPQGHTLAELPLPVRCPTMPCFGGADLRTLYITSSREKRPADELAAQPLAGGVLQMRVEVPGLPAYLCAAVAAVTVVTATIGAGGTRCRRPRTRPPRPARQALVGANPTPLRGEVDRKGFHVYSRFAATPNEPPNA
ncbi:SMP-30/gluconolactonase/LRE family protein [Paucibacter sp. O1-1]|nr:SMP-30/gluconolactonase/LRE family protein [Paucibacter sp. O1-1]MDA3826229.1 SMP-30/gluconolactonase/LRE family protein [Paucibacter sp. O1-1]